MPLIRKPAAGVPEAAPDARRVFEALASTRGDERWAAARAAVAFEGADAALALAVRSELDSRVREAMLTSLARIGTPLAVDTLLSMLRSDTAAHRAAALDALRLIGGLPAVVELFLSDSDPDVRLLSCDLARSLPAALANTLLCGLLDREDNVNVCAAAVDVLAEVGNPGALVSLTRCAERFRETPFLLFAITTVSARINATSTSARG